MILYAIRSIARPEVFAVRSGITDKPHPSRGVDADAQPVEVFGSVQAAENVRQSLQCPWDWETVEASAQWHASAIIKINKTKEEPSK